VITAVLSSEGLKSVVEDSTDLTAAVPAWLQADHDNMVGKVLRLPERSDIDISIQESLIVELYSK
jgi:small subunit ribosomal protein S4